MKCYNCGHELNEGAKYCPICGFPIEQANNGNNVVNQNSSPGPAAGMQQPVNIQPSSKWGGASTALKHKTEMIVLASIIGVLILAAVIFANIIWGLDSKKPDKAIASGTTDSSSMSSTGTDDSEAGNTAVNDIGKWEVSHIIITEIDGVLYNNQGLSNDEFKDNIEDCYFSKDSSACAVLDKENNLYFVRGDLTTELVDKGSFAEFSGDGSCMIYLNSASIKMFDCKTSETKVIVKADNIDETAVSANGEYIGFLNAEHEDGNTKYNYYVYTKDGEEVSADVLDERYTVEGLSNDGKKVYFQCYALGEGAVYYLKDGKVSKIEGSEDHGRAYFDSGMDDALIVRDDSISYFSSETGKSEKIASGNMCILYPKGYYNNLITATMYDISLEGCVIDLDDKFYRINDQMKLVDISAESIAAGCDYVSGSNGNYKFLYQENNKCLHMVTIENGQADDTIIYESNNAIYDIEADSDFNDIWITTYVDEIYHVTKDGAEKIDYATDASSIRVVYDIFCERFLFCGNDKKLACLNQDNEITVIRENCDYITSDYPFSNNTICIDTDKKYYKVYGNMYIEYEQ